MKKPVEKYPIPKELGEEFGDVEGIIEDLDFERAVTTIKSILDRAPDHPQVMVALAKVYFHMGSSGLPEYSEYTGKSEKILLDVIERYPDLAIAHSFLGILYMWTDRRKEAAQYAQTALKLEPRSCGGWNALGFYYALSGDYTKALDFFLVAYTIDPSSRVAAYNISAAYAKMENVDGALEYLEYALKSRRLFIFIEEDKDFDEIRGLPEYIELISEAGGRFDMK
jgi:tetratricopeptide (TPR) repeat protein